MNVLTSNSFATPSYGVPASVLHWACASDEAANRGSRIRSATRSVGHKWCRVANGQMGSAQNARRGAASDAADENDPEKRPLSVLRPLLTHAPSTYEHQRSPSVGDDHRPPNPSQAPAKTLHTGHKGHDGIVPQSRTERSRVTALSHATHPDADDGTGPGAGPVPAATLPTPSSCARVGPTGPNREPGRLWRCGLVVLASEQGAHLEFTT